MGGRENGRTGGRENGRALNAVTDNSPVRSTAMAMGQAMAWHTGSSVLKAEKKS